MKSIEFFPKPETDWYYKTFPYESLELGHLVEKEDKGHLLPVYNFHPVLHPRLGLNSWKDIEAVITKEPGKIKDDKGNDLLPEFFIKNVNMIMNLPNKERTEEVENEFQVDYDKYEKEFIEAFGTIAHFNPDLVKDLVQEFSRKLGIENNEEA